MRLNLKEYVSLVFVLVVLFLPTKSFYFYYSAVLIVASSLFLVGLRSLYLSHSSKVFICFFLLITCVFLFRVMVFSNFEDAKEWVKLLVVFLVILSGINIRQERLELAFSLFVFLNFVFAMLQYLAFYDYGIRLLTEVYNADQHILASLSYSAPRALGFSSGPGQQSVISLFFLSYFLVLFFWYGRNFNRFVIIIIVLGTLFLSQSKTALIALGVGGIGVFCFVFMYGALKDKLIIWFLIFGGGLAIFWGGGFFIEIFPEYGRLISQGASVSSLNDRFENWLLVLSAFVREDSVFYYLFGIGRSGLEYYGLNDIAYDSDYLYVLVVYGLVGLVFICSLSAWFVLYWGWRFSDASLYCKVLVFIILFAVPAALALNYFVEPRLFVLLPLIVSLYFSEAKLYVVSKR